MRRVLHSAIDKVFNWNNLKSASRKVIQNKGSGGVDGMSVEQWARREDSHLAHLRKRLIEDTYRSKPVKRVYIDKPGSKKKRPLGIPVIQDRVCQQAVHQVLSPVFEEYFHENSYAFRPGRSTQMAARRIEELKRAGYRVVVDLDIRDFYGQISHEILEQLVREVVPDRRVRGLIRGWLKAGVMEEGRVRHEASGTPQGGCISPLLSNVYLTVLDNALGNAGYQFVRYADDVAILCRSEEEAQRAMELVRETLAKLKLELNEEKTKITSFRDGFDFLGFHFGSHGRGVGEKSVKAFYRKVRATTRRQQGDRPVKQVIEKLNPILRGWGNYHREGQNMGLFKALDKWVRKRLRSYIYKRFRTLRWPAENKPTAEEFGQMGLLTLEALLRAGKQA